MKTIYDITGEKFFTPLSSKNKYLYLTCILFIHDLLNDFDVEEYNHKEYVLEKLEDKLNNMADDSYFDEETDVELIDNYAKSRSIVRALVEYGWLYEEPVNGISTLDFNSFSLNFIALIKDLVENDKALYSGYFKQIKNGIEHFDYTDYESLDMIKSNINSLILLFRKLYSKINSYYKTIAKNKNKLELSELLEMFMTDYKDSFFDSAYIKLKVDENIERNINYLIDKTEEVFYSDRLKLEVLINNYKESNKDLTYIDAKNYIDSSCKEIIRNIKSIPSYISRIDNKNNRYVTKTISTIHYLINRGQDIEGTLNRLIEYVKEDKVNENIFNVLDMNYYSFNRLSKPKSRNIIINPGMMKLNLSLSEDEKEKTKKLIDEELKYSIESVNDFVLKFLNNDRSKLISEMALNTKEDFVMVIAILMHSKSPIAKYYVNLTNTTYENDNFIITDFNVVKKGV